MDPIDRLDEIAALVEGARSVPMSASCIVNRDELLDLLDALRGDLPAEVRKARALLEERDEIVAAGHREAERLVNGALSEHRRLVSEADVTVAAQQEAAALLADARTEAERLRTQADDYVDEKLAELERLLSRTLATVQRGRDRLRARSEIGGLSAGPDDPAGG